MELLANVHINFGEKFQIHISAFHSTVISEESPKRRPINKKVQEALAAEIGLDDLSAESELEDDVTGEAMEEDFANDASDEMSPGPKEKKVSQHWGKPTPSFGKGISFSQSKY